MEKAYKKSGEPSKCKKEARNAKMWKNVTTAPKLDVQYFYIVALLLERWIKATFQKQNKCDAFIMFRFL